jgi:hypothetical protein
MNDDIETEIIWLGKHRFKWLLTQAPVVLVFGIEKSIPLARARALTALLELRSDDGLTLLVSQGAARPFGQALTAVSKLGHCGRKQASTDSASLPLPDNALVIVARGGKKDEALPS